MALAPRPLEDIPGEIQGLKARPAFVRTRERCVGGPDDAALQIVKCQAGLVGDLKWMIAKKKNGADGEIRTRTGF